MAANRGEVGALKRRVMAFAVLIAGMVAVVASSGQARQGSTVRVDDDRAECPKAEYTTIQSAVDAAAPGTRIVVCPGTYPEQVTVPAGKDGLDLVSHVQHAAVIRAPATTAEPGDIVLVDGARNVTLRDFTVAGPLPDTLFCSVARRTGVRVTDGGSAAILRNHVSEIRSTSPALRGCQNGIAIAVDAGSQAEVAWNLVDLYQKGGVLVNGEGARAVVRANRVADAGATEITAPNGIQISRGAEALVAKNEVSGNVYDLAPDSSGTGILLFEPGPVTVEGNEVTRNDDGIALVATQGATVRHNVATDQLVYDGLYADADSTGNRFEGNRASGNAEHDCHDESVGTGTAGTANEWTRNRAETENREGLCTQKRGKRNRPTE
jgi:parallel beta-helix repeat protein